MALWDQLRGLELNIDDVGSERKSIDVSTQFTRVTTTVVFAGEGEQGRGEDDKEPQSLCHRWRRG